MKNKTRTTSWSPSRYRSAEIEQAMRAEPGVVLADVLQRTGGVYETTTRLTPEFREIAELTSDDEFLRIAELPEVPVSLEHLRDVDPQTCILVGYRLDVTPAESPRRVAGWHFRLISGSRCILTRLSFRALREGSGVLCAGTRPAGKRAIVRQRRSAKNPGLRTIGACP
jgi:hypothetical protein